MVFEDHDEPCNQFNQRTENTDKIDNDYFGKTRLSRVALVIVLKTCFTSRAKLVTYIVCLGKVSGGWKFVPKHTPYLVNISSNKTVEKSVSTSNILVTSHGLTKYSF